MATPETQRRVDMAAFRAAAQSAGYEITLDARVILLVRPPDGEPELSVYDTGKLLLKTTDAKQAQAAYDAIRPLLEAAWS